MDNFIKELINKLIKALKAKGWNGEEITALLVEILE